MTNTDNEDAAKQFAQDLLVAAGTKALAVIDKWQVVATGPRYPYRRNGEQNTVVSRISNDGFKVANGSGYDSKYFEFEVLHIIGEAISSELIYFTGMEREWQDYLSHVAIAEHS